MITSTSSSQVKHVVNLQKKAKLRKEEKQFVVEGVKMVSEAPADRLVKVYVSEIFKADNEEFLERMNYDSIGKDVLEIVTDNVFMRMADTQTPQGIMAVVRMKDSSISDMLTDNPLLILVENLQDPGNLGTILRTAEGAGVTGILMDRECVDIYNPKTIRSTMGSVYRMPFVYVEDLGKGIQDLKDKGITTYAAHLEGKHSYDEENLTNPCAFLIGNEGNGLRREIADMADCYIKIPMLGQVESLNAAIASSVLMFEAARQRRKAD